MKEQSTPKHKTTGHIKVLFFSLFLVLFSLLAAPTFAITLQVMIANDPSFGSESPDDLYTAGIGFELDRDLRHYSFGERMFTDREAGLRFDETYLNVERHLKGWGRWQPTLGLGVLHIGKGLLGESAQNSVHHLIGSEQIHLDYQGDNRFFGEFLARLERQDELANNALLVTAIELRSAPGFRTWLRSTTRYEASFSRNFTYFVAAGFHAEEASFDLLERNIERWGLAGDAGISWRSLTLRWSYNDLGTKTSHLILGVAVPLRKPLFGEESTR